MTESVKAMASYEKALQAFQLAVEQSSSLVTANSEQRHNADGGKHKLKATESKEINFNEMNTVTTYVRARDMEFVSKLNKHREDESLRKALAARVELYLQVG